ncbi:carbohydrate ABC transporter permease [Paenibacillus endoradicis]|uniref:carbohydrate ABC transporter permease n=1 Tax=Paenibacillus endoradicis TaxID=2972487 RepID=UPI0021590FF4|nr:carbohydrate ABC transporter permease [Paenibacillus endoradicis]MCR8655857.1 carbohydrate ABC transporter permease [Paenibacillus endoradicis]MCR8658183.1 carbohydrate ABC transporter permease [Paenibacillus endoradicis]
MSSNASKLMKRSVGDKIFDTVNVVIMLLAGIITLYPFLNVLAISLNDSVDTVRGGITIFPREFTWQNYQTIFGYESLGTGLRNTLIRTILGTGIGVLTASMLAYTLSRIDFQARKWLSPMFAMTMYFSGGLIPGYMLMRHLGLIGTFEVYLLPALLSVWNVFIVRSYIDGLPLALQESAKIDGANDLTIFWKIILPLCTPVLATIALFIAVGHWNAWFDTYLYNSQKPQFTTLQYELMKVLQSTQSSANYRDPNAQQAIASVSPESIRMAITIVVTVPILFIYPFLQRYFVKGMTLGAVKS